MNVISCSSHHHLFKERTNFIKITKWLQSHCTSGNKIKDNLSLLHFSHFSTNYSIMGICVGKTNYFSLQFMNENDGKIIYLIRECSNLSIITIERVSNFRVFFDRKIYLFKSKIKNSLNKNLKYQINGEHMISSDFLIQNFLIVRQSMRHIASTMPLRSPPVFILAW